MALINPAVPLQQQGLRRVSGPIRPNTAGPLRPSDPTAAPIRPNAPPPSYAQPVEPTTNEFQKGLRAGLTQLSSATSGVEGMGRALIGDTAGADAATQEAVRLQEKAGAIGPSVTDISNVNNISDFGDWLAGTAGTQLPIMSSMLVGGPTALAARGGARVLGKTVLPKLAPLIPSSQAASTGGMITAATGLESGSIFPDINSDQQSRENQTPRERALTSLGFGVAAGGMEALPFVGIFKRFGADKAATQAIKKSLAENVAKGVITQGAIEGGTEGVQTIIERAALKFANDNRDIFTDEGINEIKNAMAGGVFLGGSIGGAGGVYQTAANAGPLDSSIEELDAQDQLEGTRATTVLSNLKERFAGQPKVVTEIDDMLSQDMQDPEVRKDVLKFSQALTEVTVAEDVMLQNGMLNPGRSAQYQQQQNTDALTLSEYARDPELINNDALRAMEIRNGMSHGTGMRVIEEIRARLQPEQADEFDQSVDAGMTEIGKDAAAGEPGQAAEISKDRDISAPPSFVVDVDARKGAKATTATTVNPLTYEEAVGQMDTLVDNKTGISMLGRGQDIIDSGEYIYKVVPMTESILESAINQGRDKYSAAKPILRSHGGPFSEDQLMATAAKRVLENKSSRQLAAAIGLGEGKYDAAAVQNLKDMAVSDPKKFLNNFFAIRKQRMTKTTSPIVSSGANDKVITLSKSDVSVVPFKDTKGNEVSNAIIRPVSYKGPTATQAAAQIPIVKATIDKDGNVSRSITSPMNLNIPSLVSRGLSLSAGGGATSQTPTIENIARVLREGLASLIADHNMVPTKAVTGPTQNKKAALTGKTVAGIPDSTVVFYKGKNAVPITMGQVREHLRSTRKSAAARAGGVGVEGTTRSANLSLEQAANDLFEANKAGIQGAEVGGTRSTNTANREPAPGAGSAPMSDNDLRGLRDPDAFFFKDTNRPGVERYVDLLLGQPTDQRAHPIKEFNKQTKGRPVTRGEIRKGVAAVQSGSKKLRAKTAKMKKAPEPAGEKAKKPARKKLKLPKKVLDTRAKVAAMKDVELNTPKKGTLKYSKAGSEVDARIDSGAQEATPTVTERVASITKELGLPDIKILTVEEAVKVMASSAQAVRVIRKNNKAVGIDGAIGGFADVHGGAIYVNPNMSEAEQLTTAAHEIGHIIYSSRYEQADEKTKNAIYTAFTAWRKQFEDGASDEAVASKSSIPAAIRSISMGGMRGKQANQYTLDFEEWFADNVARWVDDKSAKPKGHVEKFFAGVAADIVAVVKKFMGPADADVTKYLDGMRNKRTAHIYDDSAQRTNEQVKKSDAQMQDTTLDALLAAKNINDPKARRAIARWLSGALTKDEKRVLTRMFSMPHNRKKIEAIVGDMAYAPLDAMAAGIQLWSAGQIKGGPKSDTVLEKFINWITDAFGVINDHAKGAAIVEAIIDARITHDIESRTFKIQDTYRKDIVARASNVVVDTAAKMAGPLVAYTFTADSRMQSNPSLQKLASLIHSRVGLEGGTPNTYFEARTMQRGRYSEQLERAIGGLSEEQRARVLKSAQLGYDVSGLSVDEQKAVKRISTLLEDMYKYARRNNVAVVETVSTEEGDTRKQVRSIEHRKDYFPAIMDIQGLMEGRREFIDMLSQPKYARRFSESSTPDDLYTSIIQNAGFTEAPLSEKKIDEVGLTPAMSAVHRRSLDWIDKKDMEPFQSKSLEYIMVQYIDSMVKRAEYTSRFGTEGGKLTQLLKAAERSGATVAQMATANNYIDAMFGTLGRETNRKLFGIFNVTPPPGQVINPTLQKAMSSVIVMRNLAVLSMASFTSMADVIGIAVRSGDIDSTWAAYRAGIEEMRVGVSNIGKAESDKSRTTLSEMARGLGTIETHLTNEALEFEFGGTYMSSGFKRVNEMFFKAIGLTQLTQLTRVMALASAKNFVIKHASNDSAQSVRFLQELGLTADDIQTLKSKDGDVLKILSRAERGKLHTKASTKGARRKYDVPKAPKDAKAPTEGNFYNEQSLSEAGTRADAETVHKRQMSMYKYMQTTNLNKQGVLKSNRAKSLAADIKAFKQQSRDDAKAGIRSKTGKFSPDEMAAKRAEVLTYVKKERAAIRRELDKRAKFESGGDAEAAAAQSELDRDDRVRQGLNRWVDGAILRPNAAQRPIWASDPHYMMFFHLKSFTYAFHDRILRRVWTEMADHGNLAPAAALMLYVPAMLAIDATRDWLKYGFGGNARKRNWGYSDYTVNAMERAGIFGVGGSMVMNIQSDRQFGGVGYEDQLGAANYAGKLIKGVATSDSNAITKSLPLQNIWRGWTY